MKLFVLLFVATSTAAAQDSAIVVGTVVSKLNGSPLPYSTFSVTPGGASRFSGADGGFSVRVPSPGTFRISVKQLGYEPLDTTVVVRNGPILRMQLALNRVAYRLATVRAITRSPCSADIRATALEGVLEQVKQNAEREQLLRKAYPFRYRLERTRRLEGSGWASRSLRDTASFLSDAMDPYRVGQVVRERSAVDGATREMRIPQLTDLASETFLSLHCFSYGGLQRTAGRPTYEIDFEPSRDVASPDVRGSVFLDTATFEVRRAEFGLTRGDELFPPVTGFVVTTIYRDLFGGVAIFDEIRSVQQFRRERPTDPVQQQSEVQKLLDVRFLGKSPDSVASIPVKASVLPLDGRDSGRLAVPMSASAANMDAAVRERTEADLRSVGFYDRKLRFPHAAFLDLTELQKRITADSGMLLPEAPWVKVGATRATDESARGLAVISVGCVTNIWVNGKYAGAPDVEMPTRKSSLFFGPALSPSHLGAIEAYPPGTVVPHQFPARPNSCGTLVMWTRANATTDR